MQLSHEDSLRLNVMLRQDLQAVRIDESKMVVYALSAKGEVKVALNPIGRDEQYLKGVRQLLSTHVLGSPGGYPIYIRRWTRMSQARSESLAQLLLLGEPEAVTAVVYAPGLTDELARRAWWVAPTSEHARHMLERADVSRGSMGPILAEFLLEFLPFEEEPLAVIDSVRLVLKADLINTQQQQQLWERGKRKNSTYIGFLKAIPNNLPMDATEHPGWKKTQITLQALLNTNNPFATSLGQILSGAGQAFLLTVEKVLRKPINQDAVVALLEAIEDYFRPVRMDNHCRRDINEILKDADRYCKRDSDKDLLKVVLDTAPDYLEHLRAMLVLSMVGEQLVAPVFGLTDAIGSVMRKKIAHITEPLLEQIEFLQT